MSRRPVQQRAEANRLLLAGVEAAAVAERLGLPPRTVRRWAAALAPEVRRAPLVQSSQPRPAGPPPRPTLSVVRDDAPAAPLSEHEIEQRAEEIAVLSVALSLSPAVAGGLADEAGVPPALVELLRPRALARGVASLAAPTEEQRAAYVIGAELGLARAYRVGDLGAYTRLLSLAARLRGLERVGVEHSGSVEVRRGLSPDELAEVRRQTWARLKEQGYDEGLES